MKNISPQPAPRQNNCRNTSPAAIASQAGVDKGRPLCKAELGLLWFSLLYGGHSKRKPRSLLRSGFFTLRLVDSNLPESLRYASAMMMMLRDSLSTAHSLSTAREFFTLRLIDSASAALRR